MTTTISNNSFDNESAKIIIQKYCKKYIIRLKKLCSFKEKKTVLNYSSINSFDPSSKENNDSQNKIRESIIISIVNNRIPPDYSKYSKRWNNLQQYVFNSKTKSSGLPLGIFKTSTMPFFFEK